MNPDDVLSPNELEFLRDAVRYLERPSFLMRIANVVGLPIETLAGRVVPDRVRVITHAAVNRLMQLAASTVKVDNVVDRTFDEQYAKSGWTDRAHMLATMVTGGVGGALGMAGLAIELPLTTGIMFRSIAAIADDFGENITDPHVRVECISVFTHGGPSTRNAAMESGYWTTRFALAKLVRDAAEFVVGRKAGEIAEAIAKESAPVLIRFIGRVAAEFNIVVGEKFLAQSLPVISIVTSSAVNAAFTDHFNSVARYHFGIRRLERHHGEAIVRAAYDAELEGLRI
jgi:hypothetical protein